jgi:hypothetical protein
MRRPPQRIQNVVPTSIGSSQLGAELWVGLCPIERLRSPGVR